MLDFDDGVRPCDRLQRDKDRVNREVLADVLGVSPDRVEAEMTAPFDVSVELRKIVSDNQAHATPKRLLFTYLQIAARDGVGLTSDGVAAMLSILRQWENVDASLPPPPYDKILTSYVVAQTVQAQADHFRRKGHRNYRQRAKGEVANYYDLSEDQIERYLAIDKKEADLSSSEDPTNFRR